MHLQNAKNAHAQRRVRSTTTEFACSLSALLLLACQLQNAKAGSCNSTTENSFLWKIDVEPPVYLFGSMHIPYDKLWDDIPENAKTAFSSSQDVCFELVLGKPETLAELESCQLLPNKQTVEDVLSPEIYQRISKYFDGVKDLLISWINSPVPFLKQQEVDATYSLLTHSWQRKRPIWLLFLLSSITKERVNSLSVPVLDVFMEKAATSLGKQVAAVETVSDQCRHFNRLPHQQVEVALKVLLDYLEPLAADGTGPPDVTSESAQTYTCGDFESFASSSPMLPLPSNVCVTCMNESEALALASMEAFLRGRIITRRNRRMTNTIVSLLRQQRNETYFFVVGAGHLIVGEASVLDRLRKKGYTVHHVGVSENIEGPELPSDVVAMGDPSSKLEILELPVEEEEPTPSNAQPDAVLSDETLAEIWSKYFDRKRSARNNVLNDKALARLGLLSATVEQGDAGDISSSIQTQVLVEDALQTSSQSREFSLLSTTVLMLVSLLVAAAVSQ